MSSLTSVLADAEDGLLTLILARKAIPGSALTKVRCQLGEPGAALEAEHVWIALEADVAQRYELTRGAGVGEIEETITLHVRLVVRKPQKDLGKARDRAKELMAEVETAIRDDGSLDGSTFQGEVTAIARDGAIEDEHVFVYMDATVVALAYLA